MNTKQELILKAGLWYRAVSGKGNEFYKYPFDTFVCPTNEIDLLAERPPLGSGKGRFYIAPTAFSMDFDISPPFCFHLCSVGMAEMVEHNWRTEIEPLIRRMDLGRRHRQTGWMFDI